MGAKRIAIFCLRAGGYKIEFENEAKGNSFRLDEKSDKHCTYVYRERPRNHLEHL